MENPEEILHSLEEFAKMKPKDIPRELEEYLKFVAKTGDPVYQWSLIKSLFREKLINVITEFYESRPSVAIDIETPPSRNVEMFNYELMKNFILEKLETFASAPFTLQRLCELLTSPRKEYTRIDKYMRALEKNILVVSTTEPGGRRTENGEGIMNGIESDHEAVPEPGNEINVEEMDESYVQTTNHLTECVSFDETKNGIHIEINNSVNTITSEKLESEASTSNQDIVCVQYLSIEPVADNTIESSIHSDDTQNKEAVSVTITAINVKNEDHEVVAENAELSESEKTPNLDDNSQTNIPDDPETMIHPVETTSDSTSEVDMEMELVQSTNETVQTSTAETPSSTTVPDTMPEEVNTSKTENENISPENSITSSDISPCESSNDSNVSSETPTSNSTSEALEEAPSASEALTEEVALKDNCDGVDSTTKASGDADLECELPNEDRLKTECTDKQVVDDTQSATEVELKEVCTAEVGSSKETSETSENIEQTGGSNSAEATMETNEIPCGNMQKQDALTTDVSESSSSEASN